MTPHRHVATTMTLVHQALRAWVEGLLRAGGLDLPVVGAVPGDASEPSLVLLPYQTILESQSTVPTRPFVPARSDAPGAMTPGWNDAGRLMTAFLMERYPTRPAKGKSVGPLDPRPPLASLPGPMADWYRGAGRALMVGSDHAVLPSVLWRQPFSFVVRVAAFVTGAPGAPDLDEKQLVSLALVATGIRLGRSFEVTLPPPPVEDALLSLLTAMRDSSEGEVAEELEVAMADVVRPQRLAVGVYPHHELSDSDLALVMQAMQLPMQPTVIFAFRLALGAGPELMAGAVPEVPPVQFAEERE